MLSRGGNCRWKGRRSEIITITIAFLKECWAVVVGNRIMYMRIRLRCPEENGLVEGFNRIFSKSVGYAHQNDSIKFHERDQVL